MGKRLLKWAVPVVLAAGLTTATGAGVASASTHHAKTTATHHKTSTHKTTPKKNGKKK